MDLIKSKKRRNSSIELLKIIALMLIAISHSVPGYGNIESSTYVDMNIASNDILKIVYVILMSLGQIGNVIFIISSAYFLIDSKNAKKENKD